jgi:pimeloyl-ACP methyl ester carboxylesterase
MEQVLVSTNGVRLNVAQDGPAGGPLLILLHGFPEFWYGWRKQIPAFAQAGYRVWAPDQRGYNLSDKPRGSRAYTLDVAAADVAGLIDAAGRDRAYVGGHDWGGAVAWMMGTDYPERLHKLVVLNAPYGSALLKRLRHDPVQRRRSWYMFYFQLPWLPEITSRRNNWRLLTGMLERSGLPGTFSESEIAEYRRAWSLPGAYTGMLGWYRAMRHAGVRRRQPPAPGTRTAPVTVPTLLLWGAKDRFLGRELAEESIRKCSQGRLVYLEDATHWLHHERPDQVNALIHDFIREPGGQPAQQGRQPPEEPL